jgi:hypothetical protein
MVHNGMLIYHLGIFKAGGSILIFCHQSLALIPGLKNRSMQKNCSRDRRRGKDSYDAIDNMFRRLGDTIGLSPAVSAEH